jgi:hypothetical protein
MNCVKDLASTVIVLGLLAFGAFLVWKIGADAAVLQLEGVIVGGILGYLQGRKEKDNAE